MTKRTILDLLAADENIDPALRRILTAVVEREICGYCAGRGCTACAGKGYLLTIPDGPKGGYDEPFIDPTDGRNCGLYTPDEAEDDN